VSFPTVSFSLRLISRLNPLYSYTSLGSTYNTYPNPHLADPEMESGFAPAWMLEDGVYERAGREVHDPTAEGEAPPGGNVQDGRGPEDQVVEPIPN
jgi:hypothetical protein